MDREKTWLLRDKYGGRLTPAAKRDIQRLENGEHVSYLIGWTPFLDCKIDLSARPLIPRPETEYWTEEVIRTMRASKNKEPKILDIFCGSGCVGIAILKHIPKAKVDFADIERKYFRGIKESLRMNKISAPRARCIHSDVFENVGTTKYDLILANPPYIPTSGRAIARSVLKQEPKNALFGGKDGLRYVKKVLREAKKNLTPGGTMIIEFDPPQKPAIASYAKAQGWKTKFSKDQYGRWRFVELRRD